MVPGLSTQMLGHRTQLLGEGLELAQTGPLHAETLGESLVKRAVHGGNGAQWLRKVSVCCSHYLVM